MALTNVGAWAEEGSVGPGRCRERVGCSVYGTWAERWEILMRPSGRKVGLVLHIQGPSGPKRAGQTHQ